MLSKLQILQIFGLKNLSRIYLKDGRLSFPVQGNCNSENELNNAARTVLAALALASFCHMQEQGYDLRSRCLLIPENGIPSFEGLAEQEYGPQHPIAKKLASMHEDVQALLQEKSGNK